MLVSALCLTRNRRQWLPQAIRSFQCQTYPDKEMLIVACGVDVGDLIPQDDRIVLMEVADGHKIGHKRNVGNEHANGEVILHFDDDDWSEPGRMADQVVRLESTGKSVTGYHSIKFTDGAKWWQYRGGNEWSFDTSLCYTKSFWEKHNFEPINDGLEAGFRGAAIRAGQFISVDGSAMMHATIHAGNTGPRVMTPGNISWTEL